MRIVWGQNSRARFPAIRIGNERCPPTRLTTERRALGEGGGSSVGLRQRRARAAAAPRPAGTRLPRGGRAGGKEAAGGERRALPSGRVPAPCLPPARGGAVTHCGWSGPGAGAGARGSSPRPADRKSERRRDGAPRPGTGGAAAGWGQRSGGPAPSSAVLP